MVEKELTREKEAGVWLTTHYDESIRRYRELREEARKGIRVVKKASAPLQSARQGELHFYALKHKKGLCLKNMAMFVEEIASSSGQHRHQGGMGFFILDGRGYTLADGLRIEWKTGDLLLLPVKKSGVIHQHFNLGSKPTRWLGMASHPISEMVGGMMEQKANQPLWKEKVIKGG